MRKELRKIFDFLSKPYMRILPGNIAFSFMLALIPILSIIVYVLNILNFSFPIITLKLNNIIPEAVLDIVVTFLSGNGWNSTLFILIGIFAASTGMHALIIASNVIYGHESKGYLEKRVKAVLLTFLIVVMIILNLGILVFGDAVVRFVVNLFGLSVNFLTLFSLIKWPIVMILIYYILKIIYTTTPDFKIKSEYTTKGAFITTLLWIFSSALYSFYVSEIANYVDFYGSLANIIILLVWLYIMSFILVLGTAINVNEYKKSIEKK